MNGSMQANLPKKQMTQEDILISSERNIGEKLRIQITQIESYLLDLNQRFKSSRLLKSSRPDNELKADIQFINTKKNQFLSIFQNYNILEQNKYNLMVNNIQLQQKYGHQQSKSAMLIEKLNAFKLAQTTLDQNIDFSKKEFDSAIRNFDIASQQLHKRQRFSELSEKLTQFIQQLKNRFQQNITEQEINKLNNYRFNQFSLSINEQIIQIKQQIDKLRRIIKQLRQRFISTDIQLRSQGNTTQQLSTLQNEHNQLNEEILQITKHNNYLQQNMEDQVNKIVNEKIDTINLDSYQHANKYLMAGEYILEKFGAILDQDELNQLRAQIDRAHQSTNQKLMSRN